MVKLKIMKNLLTRLPLFVVAALASAAPALSQNIVYSEGFEAGLGNWTASGLWNLEDSSDPCGSLAAPFPEGTKAAWYGSSATCNFDTGGTNSGSLVKADWIQLPVASYISLHWRMLVQSEYCFQDNYSTLYDTITVVVTRETPTGALSQIQCSGTTAPPILIPWHERQFDITAYSGARVKISFSFNTVDNLSNSYLGLFVDDIRIIAEPGTRVCPSGALNSGCPCVPSNQPVAGGCRNSTGQSATLYSQGTPSVGADTIQLFANHMPPGTSATAFQGSAGLAPPTLFGDGLMCVTGTLLRLGTQFAPTGNIDWPIVTHGPISIAGLVPPGGGTFFYQVIYRDSDPTFCQPVPATFNLTSGERLIWTP